MAQKEKFNVYDHVTQTILAQLEAGTVPWRKPWTGGGGGIPIPLRHEGTPYQGINVLLLWIRALDQNYVSARWMTYRQSQELGGQVRKGEKSTTVVKFGTVEKDSGDPDNPDVLRFARAYRVFNADQIDGLPDLYYVKPDPPRDMGTCVDPALEGWFHSMGVPIDVSEEPAAYYTPSTDRIHMPRAQTFLSASEYFSTLSHEMAHAVGHKSRLNRVHEGNSRERYAKEEVEVELASAMVCARLGVHNSFENTAAYLQSWIDVLKTDSRAIFRACGAAQAAADWMFETAGEAPDQSTGLIAAE